MKLTACNRCGLTAKENEFEGMDVGIFTQGGSGSEEDAFTLCDPCTDALRLWIVTKPAVEPRLPPGFVSVIQCAGCGVSFHEDARHFSECPAFPGRRVLHMGKS